MYEFRFSWLVFFHHQPQFQWLGKALLMGSDFAKTVGSLEADLS
jgi:hypothetical protein